MLANIKNLLGRGALAPMLIFLFFSAIYLYAFPQPNVVYAIVVLLHAAVGLVATVYLAILLLRLLRPGSILARLGWRLIHSPGILSLPPIKPRTSPPECTSA